MLSDNIKIYNPTTYFTRDTLKKLRSIKKLSDNIKIGTDKIQG